MFKQVAKVVNGTVALPGNLATFGDQYLVVGKATGCASSSRVPATDNGAFLKGNLKVSGSTLSGTVKIRCAGLKPLSGKSEPHARTRPSPTARAATRSTTTNKTFFDDSVMDALNKCGECHGTGLQAESTRLHVNLIRLALRPHAPSRRSSTRRTRPRRSCSAKPLVPRTARRHEVGDHGGQLSRSEALQRVDRADLRLAHCN